MTDPKDAVTTILRDTAGHVEAIAEATSTLEERVTTVGYDSIGASPRSPTARA